MECSVVCIRDVVLIEGAKVWCGGGLLAWSVSRCADGFRVKCVYILGEEMVKGSVYERFCGVADIDAVEGDGVGADVDEFLVLGCRRTVAEALAEELRDLFAGIEVYLKIPCDGLEVG